MPWLIDVLYQSEKFYKQTTIRLRDGISKSRISGIKSALKEEDMQPVLVDLIGAPEKLPHYFCGYVSTITVVSREMRSWIEELDPVAHHYIPLEISCEDGQILRDQYFIFKMGEFLQDFIVLDKSDLKGRKDSDGIVYVYGSTKLHPVITWRSEKVKGRHIWADEMYYNDNAMSDELYERICEENKHNFWAEKGYIE